MRMHLMQLQQLNDFVTQEWVKRKILRKTLKRRDRVIILDNSSYHKRLDIQKQITKEFIILEFLQLTVPI